MQISKLLEEKMWLEFLQFKHNYSKTRVVTQKLSTLLFVKLFQQPGEELLVLIYCEKLH